MEKHPLIMHQQQQQQQQQQEYHHHLRRPQQRQLQPKEQQQQQQQQQKHIINILRRRIKMMKGADKKTCCDNILLKKKKMIKMTRRMKSSSPSLRRWMINRILLLIVVLLLPPPFGVIYLCSSTDDGIDRPSEKSLLIELFEATRGDLWKNNDNWKTNQPICSWYGVSCDDGTTANDNDNDNNNEGSMITRLDLSSNNLNGQIPSMLWKLPKLNHINVRSNLLTGIGLEGLQTIDPINDPRSPIEMLVLSENHLTTIDEVGIGYARETLVNLNLNKNQLSTLPTSIWELTNLQTLYVAFNQISGTIPTLIGKLSKLIEFYAFDNRYTGQLPSELGLLDSCEIFGLGNNFITGTLPTDMNQMANIHDLSIHHVDNNNNNGPRQQSGNNNNNNNNNEQQSQQFAGITGPLLTFGDMPFLSLLFLDGNSLTGTIPSDFLRHNSNTGQPVTVGLMNNQLTGTIPEALERFDALSIDLVGNTIIEIPTELCSKGGWMGGLVEEHQCDAILCPLGTYNTDGRATGDDNLCLPCDDDTAQQYLGSTSCFSPSSSSGSTTTTTSNNSMMWQILQSFYRTLGGDTWTDKTGWDIFDGRDNNHVGGGTGTDDDTSYCDSSWFGIDCDDSNSIIGISLPQNELFGTVPDSIFALSTLKVLDISNNNVVLLNLEGAATAAAGGGGDNNDSNNNNLHTLILSNIKMGSISGLEQLTNLEHLYLDGQTFATELPDDLYKLTNLRALHLQHGQFHGTISSQIGMLSDLTLLNMYGNELSGQLPSELGLLTRLLSLDLSENQFEGTLPTEMDQMTNLAIIAIHQTGGRLNGQIPAFDSYPNLKELNLESNMFEGQLPDNFLAGVADKTTAITVSLGYNQLTGSVPTSLTEFRLLNLKLEGNQISSLPQTLCDPNHNGWMDGEVGRVVETMKCDAILCPPLTWNENGKATNSSVCKDCPENDSLYGQTLCSSAPENRERQILDKLFAMTGGRYWSRSHDNWLRPGVPICQREQVHCFDSNADEGVREILLNGFGLRGTIPSEIWELSSARELAFTNNAVDVSFQGVEKATALQTLKLSNCHLRSLEGLGEATSRLTELHIAFNQFNGTIPEQLFSLDNLDRLFLNNNHFSSRIPSDIQKMTALVTLELQDNKLTGPLPSELGLLTNLQTLQVQQNDLSGVIPSDLQSLQSLTLLDISNQIGKKFQGAFPPFPSSPLLTTVDASRNAFSGGLPSDFLSGVDPTATLTVDLSMNHFEGTVPEEWSKFETMEIDISGNMLTSLPEALCGNVGWNDGMVGILGSCNAILCPVGFAQPAGRQTDAAHPCQECPGGLESARFLGSRECLDPDIVEQANILTTFYTATNGTDWLSQTNWLSSDPVCVWFGIKCNEDGNVVEIHLGNNLLKGDSSGVSSIFALPELKVLDLKNNDITLDYRTIPSESQLEFLRMSGTGLSSLTGIARATRLKELHATNNDLVYLSNEIFDMVSLEALFLSFNGIVGTMSRNIGRLSNLRQFYVYGNRLTGSLPSELGQVSSLVEFVAASNFLSGVLPTEISGLPNLEQFTVANQQGLELITGPIPTFAGATKLWYFDVSNNDLTGPVPQNFMVNSEHKSEAVTVYMTNNEIEGTIPSRLSEFDRLDIDLVGNKIVEIPDVLCHLDNWMEGNVKEVGNCNAILCPQGTFNQFGKESPGNPCSPCPHLEDVAFLGRSRCEDFTSERDTLIRFFDATGGEFWNSSRSWKSEAPICSWGGILCEDGDLQDTKGITSITLEKNGLSGTLPSDVWTLPSLRRMQVDDNPNLVVNFNGISNAADTLLVASMSRVKMSSLTGISAATSLRELHVAGNNIQGTFPHELFALSVTLEALYIEHNLFYGSLPTRLGEMTELQAFFAFGNDFLSTLPTELGRLKNLRTLVLSENLLYGQIPHELSQMPNLQVLSIFRQEKSGPRLFGTLPTMDKLPQLIELLLQGNEIKGSIPSVFLSASRSVRKIDLSSNLLTGEVPSDLLISSLTLLLADNYIEGFPTPFCEAEDWMDGNVASFGCDAFLCPPGTASSIGRTIDESTRCQNCTKSGVAPFHGSTTCDGPTEREILMNFYYAVGGVFWYRNDFWGSTADICNWYGIGCTGGRVVMINLRANNLRGRPGPDLFNLRDLQILWLYSNPITFSFENIGNAAKLQDLRLDSTLLNSLYGIGSASSLISFDARFAPIQGQFPEEILQLTNLRTLALGNNELSGSLPTSFSKLRYLVQFSANSNRLTGRLPAFADLPFLRYIDVSHNQLTGPISRKFLDNIPATASPRIKVSQNQLTGVIPEEFDRFREMELYAADNEILGMPLILCDNDDWNGGDVGAYGCDAILCKPGSFSKFGRNTPDERCRRCLTAYHYGATTCDDRSASYRLKPLSSAMIVTLVAGWFFF